MTNEMITLAIKGREKNMLWWVSPDKDLSGFLCEIKDETLRAQLNNLSEQQLAFVAYENLPLIGRYANVNAVLLQSMERGQVEHEMLQTSENDMNYTQTMNELTELKREAREEMLAGIKEVVDGL